MAWMHVNEGLYIIRSEVFQDTSQWCTPTIILGNTKTRREDIHCGLTRHEMVQKKEPPQICQSWIDRPLALQRASYFSSNWSIQVMETPISWAMKTKQLSLFCFCGQKVFKMNIYGLNTLFVLVVFFFGWASVTPTIQRARCLPFFWSTKQRVDIHSYLTNLSYLTMLVCNGSKKILRGSKHKLLLSLFCLLPSLAPFFIPLLHLPVCLPPFLSSSRAFPPFFVASADFLFFVSSFPRFNISSSTVPCFRQICLLLVSSSLSISSLLHFPRSFLSAFLGVDLFLQGNW